jgi:hypothetical protein
MSTSPSSMRLRRSPPPSHGPIMRGRESREGYDGQHVQVRGSRAGLLNIRLKHCLKLAPQALTNSLASRDLVFDRERQKLSIGIDA